MKSNKIVGISALIFLAVIGLVIFPLILNKPVNPCLDKSLLVSYSFSKNQTNSFHNICNITNGTVASGRTEPKWFNTEMGGALRFEKNGAVGDCIDTGVGQDSNYSEVTLFVCGQGNSDNFGDGNFMHFYINIPGGINHGARIAGYSNGSILFETSAEYYITPQSYHQGWHCYAMSCGNSQCDLYLDANKIGNISASNEFNMSTNVYVGCRKYFNNQGETVNADITEARFYSRKLSQEEILTLYDNLAERKTG